MPRAYGLIGLKDHGHTVLNPKLPDDDFDEAVRIAQAEYDHHHDAGFQCGRI